VGEVEPGGSFVIEIRERALGQKLSGCVVLRNDAWIANRADATLVCLGNVTRPWPCG
jgi:hypothetical protein